MTTEEVNIGATYRRVATLILLLREEKTMEEVVAALSLAPQTIRIMLNAIEESGFPITRRGRPTIYAIDPRIMRIQVSPLPEEEAWTEDATP